MMNPKVQIIDKEMRVHMAHIDIHYGFSVNGVAAINTEILKETELNHFYKIYPEKIQQQDKWYHIQKMAYVLQ